MEPESDLREKGGGSPSGGGVSPGRLILLAVVGVFIVVGIWVLQGGTPFASDPSGSSVASALPNSLPSKSLPPARVGQPAPDFVLNDLDGKAVRLSDFRGKVVFINFWASWCPPCRAEMPDIQSVYDEYRDKGVVVLAVNVREDPETARRFIKSLDLSFPVLPDSKGEVSQLYRVSSLPTSFFVNPQGMVSELTVGSLNRSAMIRRIERAMEE